MSIRFQTAVGTRDCDRRSNGRSNSCRVGKTNSTWKSRGLILSARQQVVGVRGAGLLDCPAARPRYYTSPPEENVVCTQSVKRHSALLILVIHGVRGFTSVQLVLGCRPAKARRGFNVRSWGRPALAHSGRHLPWMSLSPQPTNCGGIYRLTAGVAPTYELVPVSPLPAYHPLADEETYLGRAGFTDFLAGAAVEARYRLIP